MKNINTETNKTGNMKIFNQLIIILIVIALMSCHTIKEKPLNNKKERHEISKKEAICCCTDLWIYCFYFEPSIKFLILNKNKSFLTPDEYQKIIKQGYFYYVYTVNTKNNKIIDFKLKGIKDSLIQEKIKFYVLENVKFSYKFFKEEFKIREIMNLSGDIHLDKLNDENN